MRTWSRTLKLSPQVISIIELSLGCEGVRWVSEPPTLPADVCCQQSLGSICLRVGLLRVGWGEVYLDNCTKLDHDLDVLNMGSLSFSNGDLCKTFPIEKETFPKMTYTIWKGLISNTSNFQKCSSCRNPYFLFSKIKDTSPIPYSVKQSYYITT